MQAGMKQQTLATLLKISQGYLSRLEAEQIRPRGEVLARIERLLGAPEQISLLDQIMLTVRLSPHMVCLIAGKSPFTLLASSEGNISARSPFHHCVANQPLARADLASFMEGVQTLTALKHEGVLEGAAGHLWHCQAGGEPAAMKSIHIPIGAGRNRSMWHTSTVAITEAEFDFTESQWGGRLALEGRSSFAARPGGSPGEAC